MVRFIRHILSLLLVVVAFGAHAAQAQFSNETLNYVVTYKWGVIHKEAGDATVTLRRNGDRYKMLLTGKTRPWADRIYRLRDTLECAMRTSDLKPIFYEKRMHEGDKHQIDKVVYSHSGNTTNAKVTKYRFKNGENTVKETTLSATGPVYDFLSIFYYVRKLDYSKLDKYKSYQATVFSGSDKETLKIKCIGVEKVTMPDKSQREAYHLKFNFTQKGGKKSSDDIDTWISTDSSHTPLLIVGRLPVGEIRVTLKSSKG